MKYFMIAPLILFAFLFTTPAIAADNSAWEKDIKRIEELANIENKTASECKELFDILWSHTQKNNFEASAGMTVALLPPPHMDSIAMPGQARTQQAMFYNGLIIATHTFGLDPDDPEKMKEFKELYAFTQDKAFLCVAFSKDENASYKNCTEYPNMDYSLPRFEDYAASIEAHLKNGNMPRCYRHNETMTDN